jgi:putative ABC transport system substrate-binding protein
VAAPRACLLALASALAAAGPIPGGLDAQTPRLAKIGVLTESWGPTPSVVGLRDGLRDLGHREHQDFVIGVRFTQGRGAELPDAARDLIRHGVDVIVATGDNPAVAARQATTRIPIVFLHVNDPVGQGLVRSFARPGGNVTGIADLELDLVPKRMQIFQELVPGLKRVLLVYDAADAIAASRLAIHREAAARLGLTLVERPVRTEDEARSVLAAVDKGEIDGIFPPRLLLLNIPGLILEIAPERGIPAMFDDVFYVERGALASYASNLEAMGRQAARLVDKILKGARPGDIPVEHPTRFELTVNRKAATALGITIPPSVLARADRVID